MEWSLSLQLPEEFEHLSMVRRVSRDVLGSFGIRAQDVDDIEALVGELTTNAVRHAHDGSYSVEVALSGDLAVVTVRDQGKGFQRKQVLPPGTERADCQSGEERFGGWGLPMVEMLADRVEFSPSLPHGTTVRAEKRLQSTPDMVKGGNTE